MVKSKCPIQLKKSCPCSLCLCKKQNGSSTTRVCPLTTCVYRYWRILGTKSQAMSAASILSGIFFKFILLKIIYWSEAWTCRSAPFKIIEKTCTHWFGVDISPGINHQGGHVLVAVFGGPVQSCLFAIRRDVLVIQYASSTAAALLQVVVPEQGCFSLAVWGWRASCAQRGVDGWRDGKKEGWGDGFLPSNGA